MGIVFDIQKFCLHDGPGIRTSVFLKGCMLRCIWCHNPESFKKEIELSCKLDLCNFCKSCEMVCPNNVHSIKENKHTIFYEKCMACGRCVDVCLNKALNLFGEEMTPSYVIEQVLQDKEFYDESGGGVTFTGGEPTMQFEFLMELLKISKEKSLHVCLETNGIISPVNLFELMDFVDLFLLDFKVSSSERHKELTGVGNKLVFDTINSLHKYNKPVILRCPIIQGVNDTAEHFNTIKRLKKENENILDIEIMAYHSYGKQKWQSLSMEYALDTLESANDEQKRLWESLISGELR